MGCQLLAASGSDFRHALLCRQHPLSPTRLGTTLCERNKKLAGNHQQFQSPCVLVVGGVWISWDVQLPVRRCDPNGKRPSSIALHQQEYGLLRLRAVQSIGMNGLESAGLQDTFPQRPNDRLHTCQSTHLLGLLRVGVHIPANPCVVNIVVIIIFPRRCVNADPARVPQIPQPL